LGVNAKRQNGMRFALTPEMGRIHEMEKVFNFVCKQVTGHAKRRQCNNITTEKMNRKANASAKSKEVQRHPQADTRLHHICFCPTVHQNFKPKTNFLNKSKSIIINN